MKTTFEDEEFYKITRQPTPSTNMVEFWLTHYSKHEYPAHTSLGGKWLILADYSTVDKIW